MDEMKQRNWSILLGSVFLVGIASIGAYWFFTYSAPERNFKSGILKDSEGVQLLDESFPNLTRTEVLIAKEEALESMESVAKSLLKKKLLDISDLIELQNFMELAENDFSKGKFPDAINIYNRINHSLKELNEKDKNREIALRIQAELKEKLLEFSSLRSFAKKLFEMALFVSDQGNEKLISGDFSSAKLMFEEGLKIIDQLKLKVQMKLDQMVVDIREKIELLNLNQAAEQILLLKELPEQQPLIESLNQELKVARILKNELENIKLEIKSGNELQAMDLYKTLIQKYPNSLFLKKRQNKFIEDYRNRVVLPIVDQAKKLFDDQEYQESLVLLKEAKKKMPGDPSIDQAIKNVEVAIEEKEIRILLQIAYEKFRSFDWLEAKNQYNKILQLDPNNEEARKGSLESAKRYAEVAVFNDCMENAQKYFIQGRFPKALRHFNKAVDSMPNYLSLTSYQEQIRQELEVQKKPLQVKILSDSKTWVSILGVLPPVKFREKTIDIYPDLYQLRGKRSGYQDFVLEYAMDQNNAPIVLVIECSEKR